MAVTCAAPSDVRAQMRAHGSRPAFSVVRPAALSVAAHRARLVDTIDEDDELDGYYLSRRRRPWR